MGLSPPRGICKLLLSTKKIEGLINFDALMLQIYIDKYY